MASVELTGRGTGISLALIIIVLVVALIGWAVSAYNGLVQLHNRVGNG